MAGGKGRQSLSISTKHAFNFDRDAFGTVAAADDDDDDDDRDDNNKQWTMIEREEESGDRL